jgi:transcriptional regulator GlxA family with amidase domain
VTAASSTRRVPVFVVVPPRPLLLDIAGPIEVLRWANHVQDEVRFDVSYLAPLETVVSSIGLTLTAFASLPQSLPDDAMIVLSGDVDVTLGKASDRKSEDNAKLNC